MLAWDQYYDPLNKKMTMSIGFKKTGVGSLQMIMRMKKKKIMLPLEVRIWLGTKAYFLLCIRDLSTNRK